VYVLQKVFTAYYCLRRRSPERWSFVVKRSHLLTALIYILFGVFGFFTDLKSDRSPKNIDYFLEYESEDGSYTAKLYFNILRSDSFFSLYTCMRLIHIMFLGALSVFSAVVAFSLLLTVPVDCLVAATTCKRLYARYRHRVNRLRKNASNLSGGGTAANMLGCADGTEDDEDTLHRAHIADMKSKLLDANSHNDGDVCSRTQASASASAAAAAGNRGRTRTGSSSLGTTSKDETNRDSTMTNNTATTAQTDSNTINTAINNHSLNTISERSSSAGIGPNEFLMANGSRLNSTNSGSHSLINTTALTATTTSNSLNKYNHGSNQGSNQGSKMFFDSEANNYAYDRTLEDENLLPEDRQQLLKKQYNHMLEGPSPSSMSGNNHQRNAEFSIKNDDMRVDRLKQRDSMLSALISAVESETQSNVDTADATQANTHTDTHTNNNDMEIYVGTDAARDKDAPRDGNQLGDDTDDEDEDANNVSHGLFRQTSLEALMNSKQPTFWQTCTHDIAPVLALWAIVLALCVSYDNFGTLGIVMGPFAAALLVYIIPSMIYFRLGLSSDYQAQPLFGSHVPNEVYMLCVQALGILLLLGNFGLVLYLYFSDQVLISF
jgi:hypothetical protein